MINYYSTGAYGHDPRTFGGLIYESDFNTDYRGDDQKESSIAKRIVSDWVFDQKCAKNIEYKERERK